MDSVSKDIVLMYHGVVEGELENSFAAEDLYDVRLKDFREQMDFLKRRNYSIGLLDEGTQNKPRVVLTIDDGARLSVWYDDAINRNIRIPDVNFKLQIDSQNEIPAK